MRTCGPGREKILSLQSRYASVVVGSCVRGGAGARRGRHDLLVQNINRRKKLNLWSRGREKTTLYIGCRSWIIILYHCTLFFFARPCDLDSSMFLCDLVLDCSQEHQHDLATTIASVEHFNVFFRFFSQQTMCSSKHVFALPLTWRTRSYLPAHKTYL